MCHRYGGVSVIEACTDSGRAGEMDGINWFRDVGVWA